MLLNHSVYVQTGNNEQSICHLGQYWEIVSINYIIKFKMVYCFSDKFYK